MNRISFLILFLLISTAIHAQSPAGNTISGAVSDSLTKMPLEYVTITLFKKESKKPITGNVTDKAGNFSIKEISDGIYQIVFEFIGYNPYTLNDVLIDKSHAVTDLKNILLSQKKGTLQTVIVTAQSKLVENKIDKMVFNAEKDISSQSGVATDVLKKVPQVSVDADGNVQLAGSSGVRFLINGKPSTAFGSSITDVLQSIPASGIKSIEVITNPGAKYDAQGLGGIINILLKSSSAKGYNGNVSLTAGTRSESGSLNFNVRNNNFGVNAFLSGSKRLPADVFFNSERITTHNTTDGLRQAGLSRVERGGIHSGVGFDWMVKKFNNFSGSFSFNSFGNKGSGYNSQSLEINKGSGTPPLFTQINTSNKFLLKNTDLRFNYKRTFAKENQELEFSVNSSFENNNTESSNEQLLVPQKSLLYSGRSTNPAKTKETEFTLDYMQPIKEDVVFGTGAKASFYDINSATTLLQFDQTAQAFLPDVSAANNLFYKQQVYAVYGELSFPITKGLGAKMGGRYERTEINAQYSNAQQQVKAPGYNTFVPSVFLLQKIGEDQTLKLSYSKRIERPDYEDLNPYINISDPKNLSAGNPYLLPELGHRIELAYNRNFGDKGSAMINLFYRINDQDIQPYIVYYPSYKVGDSVFTNVSVSTRQNIGMEKNMGMNLFGDLHINPKFSLRSNVFLFRRHTINTVDKGFNTTSFNYRFNLNSSYQFTKTLTGEFFGNFNSARNEAQGRYPSFTTYSIAVRKQFWNKKGSFALTGNNIFSKYVNQRTELFGPGFNITGIRQIPFRSVAINFAWKFGKLEFKKEKAEKDNNINPPAE